MCWVLIGTTTCISRSVQLWVTSNLYYAPEDRAVGAGAGALGQAPLRVLLASRLEEGYPSRPWEQLKPKRVCLYDLSATYNGIPFFFLVCLGEMTRNAGAL